MGHSYNHGLVTSQKGMAHETIMCSFSSGAATLIDNGKSGLFSTTIAHPATGRYTFTIIAPIPPKLVGNPVPAISAISVTGAVVLPRYVEGSYSASAGTFEIAFCNTSATAVDPTDGTRLTLILEFQRYTT